MNALSINSLEKEMVIKHTELTAEYAKAFCKILESQDFKITKNDPGFYWLHVSAIHQGMNVAINFSARPHMNRTIHFTYQEATPSNLGSLARFRHYGYIMSDSGLKKVLRHIQKEIANGKTFSSTL